MNLRRAAANFLRVVPQRVLLALLKGYRVCLSPVLGPRCRFEPSCSCYAEQAIHCHGVMRGLGLIVWRVLRCHPLCRGGYDPVPARSMTVLAHRAPTS